MTEYLYHNGQFWDMYLVSTSLAQWRERTAPPDVSDAHLRART